MLCTVRVAVERRVRAAMVILDSGKNEWGRGGVAGGINAW